MLDLPRVAVRQEGDLIIITHKLKKLVVKVSAKQLDNWAMKQIRQSLSYPEKAS